MKFTEDFSSDVRHYNQNVSTIIAEAMSPIAFWHLIQHRPQDKYRRHHMPQAICLILPMAQYTFATKGFNAGNSTVVSTAFTNTVNWSLFSDWCLSIRRRTEGRVWSINFISSIAIVFLVLFII